MFYLARVNDSLGIPVLGESVRPATGRPSGRGGKEVDRYRIDGETAKTQLTDENVQFGRATDNLRAI